MSLNFLLFASAKIFQSFLELKIKGLIYLNLAFRFLVKMFTHILLFFKVLIITNYALWLKALASLGLALPAFTPDKSICQGANGTRLYVSAALHPQRARCPALYTAYLLNFACGA